jgi:maltooligosyltrehalose trehalohydrolase
MGQEWNATTPFLYFTDHEAELGRQITAGRRREFESFRAFGGPAVPDPQAHETFSRSVLDWSEREQPQHAGVLEWHRALIALRKTHPALQNRELGSFSARALGEQAVVLSRRASDAHVVVVAAFEGPFVAELDEPGRLAPVLWSENPHFGGASADAPALVGGRVHVPGAGALVLATRGWGGAP